jgi:hypothetical protein
LRSRSSFFSWKGVIIKPRNPVNDVIEYGW